MPNLEEWWNLPAFAPFFQGQKQNGKSGQYGYTGAGADTAIQPNRRVPGAGNGTYDAHEGEFVFDANATQAIGPDVLEAIRSGAKSGQVDPNTLRQAVGQPQKPGMRVGGFTGLSGMSSGMGSAVDKARESITSGLKSAANTASNTVSTKGSAVAGPSFQAMSFTPPQEQEPPLAINTSGLTPPPTKAPTAVATGVNAEAGAPKYGQFGNQTGTWTQEEIDARTKPAPEPEPDTTKRDEAIDWMYGLMKGDNAEVENMYNRYLQDIGGAGAAAQAAAKSEMARAGLGKEAIATGLSSLRRDISSNVSKAAGEMAGKSLEQATTAAKDLIAEGKWDVERADKEEEKNRTDFLGYVSTKLMTDPNYDWKNDPAAVNLAKGAWGTDYEALAGGAYSGLKTTSTTAMVNSLKADPNSFYNTAPSGGAGVFSTTVNGKTVITKEGYDEAFRQMAIIDNMGGISITVGADGSINLVDTVTGEGTSPGEAVTTGVNVDAEYATFDASYAGTDLTKEGYKQFVDQYGHAPTEDEWTSFSLKNRVYGTIGEDGKVSTSDTDVDNAITVFTGEYDVVDATPGAMKKYLETHGGKLPTATSWANWSKNDRVYDPADGDDVASAQILLNKNVSDTIMSEYLTSTGGKVGTAKGFDAWIKGRDYNADSDDDIALAMNTLDVEDVSNTRMAQYLREHGGKLGTKSMFEAWNEGTYDPQETKDMLKEHTEIPSGKFAAPDEKTFINPNSMPIDRGDILGAVKSGQFNDYMVADVKTTDANEFLNMLNSSVGKVVHDPVDNKYYLIIAGYGHFGKANVGYMDLETGEQHNFNQGATTNAYPNKGSELLGHITNKFATSGNSSGATVGRAKISTTKNDSGGMTASATDLRGNVFVTVQSPDYLGGNATTGDVSVYGQDGKAKRTFKKQYDGTYAEV